MAGIAEEVANKILAARMTATRLGPWRRLRTAAQTPRETQIAVLRRILRANAATEFGGAHGFADIDGPDAYRNAVPVQTFESLRPHVALQESTGVQALTRDPPIFYQRTSGTLGAPKDVPLTQAGLDRIRRQQRLAAYVQHAGANIFAGKVLGIGSAAVEGHTQSGFPYGSATGLIYESQPALVRAKFVLPPALFAIADYDLRYDAIAALALREHNVTALATANPSTLVKLLGVINQDPDRLLRAVADGHLPTEEQLPAAAQRALAISLRPAPERARALGAVIERTGHLSFADLWPNLAGVVTWTGGSCALPLAALRPQLPTAAKIIEAGYASSEFRGSINVDIDRNLCLPTLGDHFFEFVPRDAWERGEDKFLYLDELEVGECYYPIVTTADGLYRYDINDIVTVTGFVGATPTLAFVQKGQGVTSITGEKLTETQMLQAVQQTAGELSLRADFFVALADEQAARYELYLEAAGDAAADDTIAQVLDRALRTLNAEYDSKRASGRLHPLRARRLRPGTGDAYRRHCAASGQREAQFKVRHLQYARDTAFDFAAHALADARP